MSIPFTPFRVAVVTGLIVFASIGAPRLAMFKESVEENLTKTVVGEAIPESASLANAPLMKYQDRKGRTHYVSSIDAIPPQYRKVAEVNPRLPKVTYSNFPTTEFSPLQELSDRLPEVSLLPSQRRGGDDKNGGQINNLGQQGGEGRRSGGDEYDESSRDDGDWEHPRWSCDYPPEKRTLNFIMKWLCFTRDTFNDASAHLSGQK